MTMSNEYSVDACFRVIDNTTGVEAFCIQPHPTDEGKFEMSLTSQTISKECLASIAQAIERCLVQNTETVERKRTEFQLANMNRKLAKDVQTSHHSNG